MQAACAPHTVLAAGACVAHVCEPHDAFRLLPAHAHIQVVAAAADADDEWALGAAGLAAPSLAGAWRAVCPDASALVPLMLPTVRIHTNATPSASASTSTLVSTFDAGGVRQSRALDLRRAAVASVQEHYFEQPPNIERGWREYMYGVDGRAYLDVVNNVTGAWWASGVFE